MDLHVWNYVDTSRRHVYFYLCVVRFAFVCNGFMECFLSAGDFLARPEVAVRDRNAKQAKQPSRKMVANAVSLMQEMFDEQVLAPVSVTFLEFVYVPCCRS